MNYNLVVIISLTISLFISFLLSYYLSLIILDESHNYFKVLQLIFAIITLTTIYPSVKYLLLKYLKHDEFEGENKND